MELFIQIQNGQPFEHPIFGDNFRKAFPGIDTTNLPSTFACFVRVAPPAVGAYEVYEGMTYEWQDEVVTDVHHVRSMTAEEILQKQEAAQAHWAQHGFPSWVFDAATCTYNPPVPYPEDGGIYIWDESITNWVAPTISATN